jgi:hypothetical protein
MKSAIVLALMALLAFAWGVKFEFTIYESYTEGEGNFFHFREDVPTTATYSYFPNAKRICHTRTLYAHYPVNYAYYSTVPPYQFLGSGCENVTAGFFNTYKSFRFSGAPDTELDGVHVYPTANLTGVPIFVDHSPFGAITTPVRSVAYSGYSAWTVYEGSNFLGNTTCLPAGDGETTIVFNDISVLNITTIGSLVKGCLVPIPPEIEQEIQRHAKYQ